jgi:LmbE family N-acetylglucosaminyl deacetylase
LCLGAHSDDIEIGCGGTLLRLLQERPGSSVLWVVFSASAEREAEARGSAGEFLAAAAGSEVVVHHFKESYFPSLVSDIKDAFEQLKQSIQPDLVLVHRRNDEHQDHRVLAGLVWNTFRNHQVWEYEIPKYEGDLGSPNLYVPLTREVADRKVDILLRRFKSQAGKSWFRADTFHGLMSVRAVECNAAEGRAEAFYVRKLVV